LRKACRGGKRREGEHLGFHEDFLFFVDPREGGSLTLVGLQTRLAKRRFPELCIALAIEDDDVTDMTQIAERSTAGRRQIGSGRRFP
jgi:hypothetical protein